MKWTDQAALRKQAEAAIHHAPPHDDRGATRDELLYELSVYHAELEMQNEALRDAQTELRASETRYRDLFESGPSGYLVLDGKGLIDLANGTAGEILSAPVEELIGSALAGYLLPEEAIGFERYRREVLRSATRLTAEFKFRATGGGHRYVCVASSRLSASEGHLRVALSDVTNQRNMMRRDEHRARLEALRCHASTFAHDLNGLLISMLGYADVALQSLQPDDAPFEHLQRIRELGYRGVLSTGQLAALTRPDALLAASPDGPGPARDGTKRRDRG